MCGDGVDCELNAQIIPEFNFFLFFFPYGNNVDVGKKKETNLKKTTILIKTFYSFLLFRFRKDENSFKGQLCEAIYFPSLQEHRT